MFKKYLQEIQRLDAQGDATEHSLRAALETLLNHIFENQANITNEPAHNAFGAPDFKISQNTLPLAYLETKRLHADLSDAKNEEQFTRYKKGLGKIIFSNYSEFQFFEAEELLKTYTLASIKNGKWVLAEENVLQEFAEYLKHYALEKKAAAIAQP